MVDVRAVSADGSSVNVAGTLSGPQQVEKIVQINGRNFDLRAEGLNLLVNYDDQPGALGKIGTLLGGADVNILAAQLTQDADGDGATILLRVDRQVPDDVLAAIGRASSATDAGTGRPVMKLAVIAGDGIGPEVIAEALKVLDVVLPGVETHRVRPRRAALPRDGGDRCPTAWSTNCAATTRSCWARSVIRRCPAACWSAGCC